MAGNGKFQMIILGVTGLITMTVIINSQCMALVLPAAKCDIELTISEQGAFNSAAFLGYLVSSHCWGILTDTWGRQKTLRFTMFFSFVFSVMSSFALTNWTMFITRFLIGMWYD